MIRILTNHPGQRESETWDKFSTFIQVDGGDIISCIRNAISLIRLNNNFDIVVLGAGRADIIYLLINTIFFGSRKKAVLIDCLWYKNNNFLYHLFKKIILKIADFSVLKYVVWAHREISAYSKTFGISEDKFIFIPYHHTVNRLNVNIRQGDYLFSGGNFGRDYSTLIEAVRGMKVNLLIASTRPEIFLGIDIPENVTIRGFSHHEYLEKMASSYINIVALAPNLLHSGGQQTFLNSMYFGKPTIVLDPEGASDYITDGVDGILVEPGNPLKLKAAIDNLLLDQARTLHIGKLARERAKQHSTEDHFKVIVKLCQDLLS